MVLILLWKQKVMFLNTFYVFYSDDLITLLLRKTYQFADCQQTFRSSPWLPVC